ncbi:conserved hypothetical protein [Pyrenophora tritici-repentis Pt-1C-BFP]|uniref:Uncharacterized protein n=2 Tax=Pyrenophora tritici-repentis TaxID=45151 RepID=B2VWQ6_PYRTR|nr:uncharacterized protein PTRG_01618 [Pyrenophora tritici-repentis Pt-1C-BFP]EDU41056.1 conserved hypothetical protein [Pyrenophora tritici-repentis Pt-1C-BFP]
MSSVRFVSTHKKPPFGGCHQVEIKVGRLIPLLAQKGRKWQRVSDLVPGRKVEVVIMDSDKEFLIPSTPLHDRFKITMAEHKAIYATLGLGPNASEFRGKPSPEVDAAWDRVTQTYLYPMTKEEVIKMGNDPEYAVLMPEEMGFGKGHYAGFADVEHKIHCLDVLRKEIYSDYYGEKKSPL